MLEDEDKQIQTHMFKEAARALEWDEEPPALS
jgi:hypothetical protein